MDLATLNETSTTLELGLRQQCAEYREERNSRSRQAWGQRHACAVGDSAQLVLASVESVWQHILRSLLT